MTSFASREKSARREEILAFASLVQESIRHTNGFICLCIRPSWAAKDDDGEIFQLAEENGIPLTEATWQMTAPHQVPATKTRRYQSILAERAQGDALSDIRMTKPKHSDIDA